MMRKILVMFFFILTILTCNCHSETTSRQFSRVVSLGPYITENLLLLGIEKEIIGVTIHEKPEVKKGREIIGTLLDPNIEAIIKIKPDIVIASKEGNRKQTVENLINLGIKVKVLDEVVNYENLKNNFLTLAEIFGKKDIAKKIIDDVDFELIKYRQKRFARKKTIFWQIGTRPLFTAGSNTYFNEISLYAGGTNIFNNIKTKYITVNVEEVIKRNPDVIIVMGMGEDEYAMNFWNSFKNVKAVKKNQIFRVDDYDFCSPTPLSFLRSIKTISEFLKN
ncbi:MAG: helical backbone metal receptor [Candidatus Omnitrophica bacterium]|nr:helical backbone metal receptor [Candidatus Omnitrophota bacterium]MCM8827929.1 helical backbone metal receptor [Candidatus Omnitrophota bacterium]